jgi:hypothetical protein
MTKKGCSRCRDKDPILFEIQTYCFVVDQSLPFCMFQGVWSGAYRGVSPSWRLLGSL